MVGVVINERSRRINVLAHPTAVKFEWWTTHDFTARIRDVLSLMSRCAMDLEVLDSVSGPASQRVAVARGGVEQ